MAQMEDEKIKVTATAWGVIFAISLYGGLARYIIENKRNGYRWSWLGAVMQMMVSGFSGIMGGVLSVELNASFYYTVFAAGMCGAMGSLALDFFWAKYSGGRK
ncbi:MULTISPECIES: phage holin family protein [Morganellaceae]|uniref:Phage holin family protein n=1 Tax=Moellerella wisconsensis TaxID=158849 RepID=A0A9Q8Q499_9GAMM|nr:phage holin family protein [Moellerella wisconsensis]KLN96189.1 holin [Moellerella wisconsensis]UNH25065.1 phage holin family protein [Moellerella wisconsensis]UNH28177.1 phage holin family protein [Moellerella wisconsensis]UNH31681.1 phage holin family protein [Moellerella wisconsensis]UNH43292.1 phage holin family protein [Moellerella wisconsensis]